MNDRIKYSLSDSDISKIIKYNNLKTNNIYFITASSKHILNELNNDINLVVIHYQTDNIGNHISGHWCGMTVNNINDTINFYDPYGTYPDDELKTIPLAYRYKTNQVYPFIREWLKLKKSQGYHIEYNHYHQQRLLPGINTCGRWVAYFLRMYNGKLHYIDDFNRVVLHIKQFLNLPTLDDTIVVITDRYLENPHA